MTSQVLLSFDAILTTVVVSSCWCQYHYLKITVRTFSEKLFSYRKGIVAHEPAIRLLILYEFVSLVCHFENFVDICKSQQLQWNGRILVLGTTLFYERTLALFDRLDKQFSCTMLGLRSSKSFASCVSLICLLTMVSSKPVQQYTRIWKGDCDKNCELPQLILSYI